MVALRWGIISAGKISHDFVTALRSFPEDEHDVIAVAARDLSRAQDFAKLHGIKKTYDDYEKLAMDKDIDIVYIGAIHPHHFNTALIVLHHNKHLLCEKPLTMYWYQTAKIVHFARGKKLFLMEGVWSRFFPVYDAIRKEIASGSLGDIYQVIVPFGFKMPDIDRITKKELGGGTILDLGVYCLQFACLVYDNEEPESIQASGCLNEDGVDMSMSATLLYKGNRTATIATSALVDLPNEARICGTKGMITVPNFWCPTTANLPSGPVNVPLPELKQETNYINSAGLCYEIAEARACIQKGLTESSKMTLDTSMLLAKLEDELRKQLGVKYSKLS
ncbi:trans-1,2-dihydrobenzene-1,2-diol dehydrogenase [Linepithema humile]|uniref:trans-1,2-dihydrobenzene-1,2-diol dehydrogenase n=1 Tax=Linepithema humile TaxID=83485 RepID=UPI0006236E28|nr:PREDICTED: trans-1,2-dihydrobenzene-1,2-diol dehydrogenase-like [Linepithema humile]